MPDNLHSLVMKAASEIELSARKMWIAPEPKESSVPSVAPKRRYKLYNPTRYHNAGSLTWDDTRGVFVPSDQSKPGIRSAAIKADYGLFLNPNSTRGFAFKQYKPGQRPDRHDHPVSPDKGESLYRDELRYAHARSVDAEKAQTRKQLAAIPWGTSKTTPIKARLSWMQLQCEVAILDYMSRLVALHAVMSYK